MVVLLLLAELASLVNTSSGAGVKGFKGQAAYVAAKHGVVGLTRAAALDYAAQNIRINAVCPGIIDTPMMARFSGGTPEGRERVISQEPIGRMGQPEEIANAVVWLCSDASSFAVGHVLVADGGQTVCFVTKRDAVAVNATNRGNHAGGATVFMKTRQSCGGQGLSLPLRGYAVLSTIRNNLNEQSTSELQKKE